MFALAVILASVIYRKQVQDIKSLKSTKEEETNKNIVLTDIGKLEERMDAYKRLLKDKDAESVISNISDMAKESGVKILSIRPGLEQKYQDYVKLPFDLEISSAEYHSLGVFISKIESHSDVYIVEDVRVDSSGSEGDLRITLKVSSIEFAK